MNNTYYSIKDMKNILNNFDKKNFYHYSLSKIFNLCNEIKNIKLNTNDYISSSFINTIYSIKEGIFLIKEEYFGLIKLETSKSKYLESQLDEKFKTNSEKRKPKELARWPLFIIAHSAIICFLFSSCFHSFRKINEKYRDILSRFDYGGISLLISGSCFPPYYYFFYYSNIFKYAYLTLTTIFGIGTFLFSLTDDFNKPKKRTLKGRIFLAFDICIGVPIVHFP